MAEPDPGETRILIVAGEASGDLHGASLARALGRLEPEARCFGIGGDRMAQAGVELVYHMRHLAVVGVSEVLTHLLDVRRAMKALVSAVRRRPVSAVVLIDYPDFNLRLARRIRKSRPEVPIVYYISPQVWAWRAGRVATLARRVDKMLVILPFEEEIYADADLDTEFVGHPLLDVVAVERGRDEFARVHGVEDDGPWVALLPGSRKAEVERLLPPMFGAAERLRRDGISTFLVPVARGVDEEVYERCLDSAPPSLRPAIRLVRDDNYAAIRHSRVAAVCSGTATLETALLDTPMVVVYRTSWLTYNLAKLLVRVRDIALVNVVAGHRGVPELVQRDVTGERIAAELRPLIEDGPERDRVLGVLDRVRERLGRPGASERAARAVLELCTGGLDAPDVRGSLSRSP